MHKQAEANIQGCRHEFFAHDACAGCGIPTNGLGRRRAEAANAGMASARDVVNHPPHYNSHPSGIEAIDVTEHFNFNLGNAIKYIWRADAKGSAKEDLEKALWYIKRELHRRGLDK